MNLSQTAHAVLGTAVAKRIVGFVASLVLMLAAPGHTPAETNCPLMVCSKDGTPISYDIFGTGEPTLVFVHGWSCDARYRRAQVPVFARNHRVVILDLAGHGHSGMSRATYTMESFGEDVRAVTEATGSRRVILIGHSMGGAVIAEAARLLPGRVIGLIGIDTLENVAYTMTRDEQTAMLAPLAENFRLGCRQFVAPMIAPATDPRLRAWIIADMSAAPASVALSAMREMTSQYITGAAAAVFKDVRLPVVTVNGGLWPIAYEANRRHMASFEAIVLKDADHFLMLDRPDEFNPALHQAIRMLTAK